MSHAKQFETTVGHSGTSGLTLAEPGFSGFKNSSNNVFVNIGSEVSRTYLFPGGDEVTINDPLFLSVSAGGHRLFDADGNSHYVPKGWIHLKWKARDGQPNFVK